MTVPSWWPNLFRLRAQDATRWSTRTVKCLKCGKPTWRKLDAYTGVHRGCEEVEEVARL